jgi:DNA-binding transcriptional ArsR family regulator
MRRRALLAVGAGLPLAALAVNAPIAPGERLQWPALRLLDGSTRDPLAWQGQAAVLVFWATWCFDLVFGGRALRAAVDAVRLKIIGALCNGEKNVSQLLAQIDTTQPNMSQHLATLYRAACWAKRREGTQIYYRLQSERVATLCRAVCTQVAIELDGDAGRCRTPSGLGSSHDDQPGAAEAPRTRLVCDGDGTHRPVAGLARGRAAAG